MLSHVFIGISDFGRAWAFYAPLMEALGHPLRFHDPARPWAGWQSVPGPRPLLVIARPFNGLAPAPGNGAMVALLAATRAQVDEAHRRALAHGGSCEGAPGPRPEYHAHYYGAYFRDPDGNKLCVACHAQEPMPSAPTRPGPTAVDARSVPGRARPSAYPPPFAARMAGREKRALGDHFGLRNFGVNLTRLAPGAVSALRHSHTRQDEFIYVLEGCPTLHTNAGATPLRPGMCAGFGAGTGDAHHLVNDTAEDVLYLEVGDRTPGDEGHYPDDDLQALRVDGHWQFTHKNGEPYPPA